MWCQSVVFLSLGGPFCCLFAKFPAPFSVNVFCRDSIGAAEFCRESFEPMMS